MGQGFRMKLLVLLVSATAALAWKPKTGQPKANEVQALSCKNGRDVLSDGQEVTIETPNYPANYPNKAKCNWNIRVPAGEEVHIWCETFDVKKGDKLWIKGITEKIYGTFSEGTGDVIPASSKRRTFRVKFRSNKRKTGGGFRCQIAAVPPTTGSGNTTGTGSGSGSGASCMTVDGPAAGSSCVFPFNFGGETISSCTTIDGDTTPWCSTQVDGNGDHVGGVGAWGYCDASCAGAGSGTGSGFTPGTTVGTTEGPTTTAGTGTGTGSSCQCGVKGGQANGRIVGGQETEVHEYPWQVGLVTRYGRTPWCGGTLISPTHIMTAAHCTDGNSASNLAVLLGEHNIADAQFNRVDVAEIIQDPNYESRGTNSDFSILRLASPVTFSAAVSPACLPAGASQYAGEVATVTGWGTLSSGGNQPTVLQEVDVTITTNAVCKNAYGSNSITDVMLCAADSGRDSCQGDSGGPLVVEENGRQALVGVVSWGYGCAMAGYPGVYARVTERMDWIKDNTAGTFDSTCQKIN